MKFNSKFFLGGALAGGAWYVWWHILWSNHNQNNTLTTYVSGYGIYGSVLAGCFHPRLWSKGGLLASLIGRFK